MRWALSWLLYWLGDLVWRCFDRDWSGGMHWPIYQTYSSLMGWSDAVQGNGPGPWGPIEPKEAA